MVGVGESLSTDLESMGVVGAVLVEAIVLYVGYGALEQVFGPTIKTRLTGNR